MALGAIVYTPIFIKIGSGIQKLMRGGGLTDTQHGILISLHFYYLAYFPYFIKIKVDL
jgi:hypothetical protein